MSAAAGDSTLFPYTAADGDNIAMQDWPFPAGQVLRGVVILVHGLGEHAGRYERVARRLNGWGFAVRGYDQYGHGESGGVRGGLPVDSRLVDDLADIIDSTRVRMEAATPLILLGHSLGGLVVARLAALAMRKVEGLVLSSPALDIGLTGFQAFLLRTMRRFAPNHAVGNGLNPAFLSHDRHVVSDYRRDPLVHDRISARLGGFIADAGPACLAHAQRWTVPTLLMYAGRDAMVMPQASRAFAAAAPADVVTARCFEGMYHEIFNETDPEPVYEMLKSWLDARF